MLTIHTSSIILSVTSIEKILELEKKTKNIFLKKSFSTPGLSLKCFQIYTVWDCGWVQKLRAKNGKKERGKEEKR